jgi:hypothetical protein
LPIQKYDDGLCSFVHVDRIGITRCQTFERLPASS